MSALSLTTSQATTLIMSQRMSRWFILLQTSHHGSSCWMLGLFVALRPTTAGDSAEMLSSVITSARLTSIILTYSKSFRWPQLHGKTSLPRRLRTVGNIPASNVNRSPSIYQHQHSNRGVVNYPQVCIHAGYDFAPDRGQALGTVQGPTGGKGTWKPVITCWVHLELMCIFLTM